MKQFTVFDMVTGTILRTGTCQECDFSAQAMSDGEGVIEGVGNWQTQRVVDGAFQQIN